MNDFSSKFAKFLRKKSSDLRRNSVMARKAGKTDYDHRLKVYYIFSYLKKESRKLFIYCQGELKRKRARKKASTILCL